MKDLATWCENLVQIDEEEETVQFAHYTIRKFLLAKPVESRLAEFHVDIDDADHMIGEICVTYLNFNDFKTTLMRQPKSLPLPSPVRIVESTLGPESKITDIVRARLGSKNRSDTVYSQATLTSGRGNSNSPTETLQFQYPFLNYASTNWIEHTRNFSERRSKTWNMWKDTIFTDHELVVPPWKTDTIESESTAIHRWVQDTRHYAVIRAIDSSEMILPPDMKSRMIFDAAKDNDITLLDIFFSGPNYTVAGICSPKWGDAKISQATRTVDPDWTALQIAARNGHLEVVNRLLAIGVEVNAFPDNASRTAIQAASGSGHLQIVERLIKAGANVNMAAGPNGGRTALQEASENGHLAVVRTLLRAGADVNAGGVPYPDISKLLRGHNRFYGRPALQAASENGHFEICTRLLEAGASTSINIDDLIPEAAKQGCVETLKKLLRYTSHPFGAAALCLMARQGHTLAVRTLLEAGVDVNIKSSHKQTALHEAADHGRAEIVQILVDAGADLKVATLARGTALDIAKDRGHQEVVDVLEEPEIMVKAAIRRALKRAAEI